MFLTVRGGRGSQHAEERFLGSSDSPDSKNCTSIDFLGLIDFRCIQYGECDCERRHDGACSSEGGKKEHVDVRGCV